MLIAHVYGRLIVWYPIIRTATRTGAYDVNQELLVFSRWPEVMVRVPQEQPTDEPRSHGGS